MKRVLIIGGNSEIAGSLYHLLSKSSYFRVATTTRRMSANFNENIYFLDLLSDKFEQQLELLPPVDIVVYCAAVTKLTSSQNNQKACISANVHSTSKIMEKYQNSYNIFLSSSRVFSGDESFVSPNGILDGDTVYGKSKAVIEFEMLKKLSHFAIVRITKVISASNSFFTSRIQKCFEQVECDAFKNLTISPVSLSWLTQQIYKIICNEYCGIIHLSGENDVSYYHSLEWLCKRLKVDGRYVKSIDGNLKQLGLGPYSSLSMELNPKGLTAPCSFHSGFSDLLKSYDLI